MARPRLAHLSSHAQGAVLARMLALPEPVQDRLAGPPIVRDGLEMDTETRLLLRLQRLVGERGALEYDVQTGREVLRRQARMVAGEQPVGSVEDRSLGSIPGRVYVPSELFEDASRPTLVFLHGGGFINGGLDSHDGLCRFLAERAGVQVIAVDYRLAPEAPFPAAYDDAVAAYRFVVEHAVELSADPARLAVGGDSAGGNLAAGVAIEVARAGLPLAFQLLVCPATDVLATEGSRRTFAQGFFLTQDFIDLANASYLPRAEDRSDPRASPLRADLPPGLAPALLVTAGFDPLRDEGEAYGYRLKDAGVSVDLRRYPGLIHGFFNWVGVGRSARGAVAEICGSPADGAGGVGRFPRMSGETGPCQPKISADKGQFSLTRRPESRA